MGGPADAQGELYGGPLKNENPPELDDVAQYDADYIKKMALSSNPGHVSNAGQSYLDYSNAVAASGEHGDLLGFLQKVAVDLDNDWHGGGAPDMQLQMSMLWEAAQQLIETGSALGTVIKAHGDNNLKPYHDYFAVDGFKNATSITTTTYTDPTGPESRFEGPTANISTVPAASSVDDKMAQKALSNYVTTIYDAKSPGANTYDALPGYLTVTLPPGTLPPAPVTKPTDPSNQNTGPGAKTGPGTTHKPTTGPGGSLPANPYVPGSPTIPQTGVTKPPGLSQVPPGTTTLPPGTTTSPPGTTLPTDPSHLSNVPPGTTPPGTTPPGTTPPGTTPPGTTPPGLTPPGTTPPGSTPPVLTPPVLTPPNETPPNSGVKIPKLPNEPGFTDPKMPKLPAEPKLPGDFGSTGSTGSTGLPDGTGNATDTAIGSPGNPSAAQDGSFAAEDAMAAGRTAAMAAGGMGNGMMPMMPMGGGGMGGGGQDQERMAWLAEDEDVWGAGDDAVPPVIG